MRANIEIICLPSTQFKTAGSRHMARKYRREKPNKKMLTLLCKSYIFFKQSRKLTPDRWLDKPD